MSSPPRPLLLYDGECGFCRFWIARWRRATGDRLDYEPYQEAAARFPSRPIEDFRRAVQLLEPDGRWSEGAEASFRALSRAPGRGWLLGLYRRAPGFRAASEACYRLVAAHRGPLSTLTRWLWGPSPDPPGESLTVRIFLRALGLIYGIAFVSLWVQIPGLAGRRGILPAGETLEAVWRSRGAAGLWLAPTLCWLSPSDAMLHGLCAAGVVAALLLVLGLAPGPCLLVLSAAYLSLATVCRDFLWFQWDGLILEAGVLAMLIAPWRRRPRDEAPPPRVALTLLRWLLFRLMFSSAAVKLTSGDPTWRDLTALTYHYETQPLPPWTAWYAHHLPAGFQRASAIAMFTIEGLVPFLIFAPRRPRFVAAAVLVGFQLLIVLSGNYAFFNWLTIALCLLLLDDAAWPRRWRERFAPGSAPRAPGFALRVTAFALVVLSLAPLGSALSWPAAWLGPVPQIARLVSPFRIVNRYGLFSVMTTVRNEIVVEGSDDGVHWRAYAFRDKPGDPARRPRFVAPHQPRLDWQMWFAALDDFRGEPWFLSFCQRLLEGSKPVLGLLDRNPFPDSPPRFVRATVYEYHFTDAAMRRATGAWWRRTERGLYCPVLTLTDGQLRAVQLGGP